MALFCFYLDIPFSFPFSYNLVRLDIAQHVHRSDEHLQLKYCFNLHKVLGLSLLNLHNVFSTIHRTCNKYFYKILFGYLFKMIMHFLAIHSHLSMRCPREGSMDRTSQCDAPRRGVWTDSQCDDYTIVILCKPYNLVIHI